MSPEEYRTRDTVAASPSTTNWAIPAPPELELKMGLAFWLSTVTQGCGSMLTCHGQYKSCRVNKTKKKCDANNLNTFQLEISKYGFPYFAIFKKQNSAMRWESFTNVKAKIRMISTLPNLIAKLSSSTNWQTTRRANAGNKNIPSIRPVYPPEKF